MTFASGAILQRNGMHFSVSLTCTYATTRMLSISLARVVTSSRCSRRLNVIVIMGLKTIHHWGSGCSGSGVTRLWIPSGTPSLCCIATSWQNVVWISRKSLGLAPHTFLSNSSNLARKPCALHLHLRLQQNMSTIFLLEKLQMPQVQICLHWKRQLHSWRTTPGRGCAEYCCWL